MKGVRSAGKGRLARKSLLTMLIRTIRALQVSMMCGESLVLFWFVGS